MESRIRVGQPPNVKDLHGHKPLGGRVSSHEQQWPIGSSKCGEIRRVLSAECQVCREGALPHKTSPAGFKHSLKLRHRAPVTTGGAAGWRDHQCASLSRNTGQVKVWSLCQQPALGCCL